MSINLTYFGVRTKTRRSSEAEPKIPGDFKTARAVYSIRPSGFIFIRATCLPHIQITFGIHIYQFWFQNFPISIAALFFLSIFTLSLSTLISPLLSSLPPSSTASLGPRSTFYTAPGAWRRKFCALE